MDTRHIMKRIIILIIFTELLLSNNFINAITSGEKEGDINLIFDYFHSNPSNNDDDTYKTSSYFATSFGLSYRSAFYGYFRISLGFRGALPIIQSNSKLIFDLGKGSLARDFDPNNKAILAKSYLEYFDGDTSIKAGRLESEAEMILNELDGVWIQNKSFDSLLIDFAWINQYGNVTDREIGAFQKIKDYIGGEAVNSKNDKYGGAYYLSLSFDILKDTLVFKVYGLTTPEIYTILGFKTSIEIPYFSAGASFANSFEHKYSEFSGKNNYIFDIYAKTDINIFYGKLGYIKTSNDSGIGSITNSGNTLTPFFDYSGDILETQRDVNLIYATLGISSDTINTYVTYGFNLFKLNNIMLDNNTYKQGEINLYFDWEVINNTHIILYFINTHIGKQIVPNVNRIGTIFKLNF